MATATVQKQPPLVVDLETKDPTAIVPSASAASISTFERLATDPNVDVDKLERLMQMHERMLARSAQEQFNAAMADAQAEMRPIAADAENPQTRSRYASYAQLDRALRPVYAKYGFGISYDTSEGAISDHVRVLAYVTHKGGHEKTYKIDMPNDGKGAKGGDVMTKTHAQGAAMSYGMRYLLKMIWNVAVGEEDRDGNQVEEQRRMPEAPQGFEKFLTALQDVAPEGMKRLTETFNGGQKEHQQHLLRNYARDWAGLKKLAQGVR